MHVQGLVVIAAVLLALPPAASGGASDPRCTAPDEWEIPSRYESAEWCTATESRYAFWVEAGETVGVWTRAAPEQDIVLCLRNATQVVEVCADEGGPGNAESVTNWRASTGGWWSANVAQQPVWREYGLSIVTSNKRLDDDCEGGRDAADSFRGARSTQFPTLVGCAGRLGASDVADHFRVHLDKSASVNVEIDATGVLCVYAPRGYLAGDCQAMIGGGSIHPTIDESGDWRIAVEHVAGFATGPYRLLLNGPLTLPPCASGVTEPDRLSDCAFG